MTDKTPELEDLLVSALPGDMDPEDHVVERIAPSKGIIARQLERARVAHREAEAHPERGASVGGSFAEDLGGITVPYDARTAQPSSFGARKMPEVKMKIQTLDEAQAELRAERAKLEVQQKSRRISELEAELASLKDE